MKRVFAIFMKDLVGNFKEFISVYMLMAPLIVAIGLKFFIPSISSTSLQFALDARLKDEVIREFEKYGDVEMFEDVNMLRERVNGIDNTQGLMLDENGKFLVIMEGNEEENVIEPILMNYLCNIEAPIKVRFSDIGYRLSPVASIGSASVIIMAVLLSGMLIGLSIIEDKEWGTISALGVTPLSKAEYISGKSLGGFFLSLIQTYITLWILGLTDVNLTMILVMTVASTCLALVFGFVIGVMNSNQISAIATTKFAFLLVSASILGALFLPPNWQFVLYWSPIYWSFIGLYGIVVNNVNWFNIVSYSLIIIGLTRLIFLGFKNRIRTGLS